MKDAAIADIPVVVVSADPDAARHAATPGVAAAMTKPIDFERLLNVVGQYVLTAARASVRSAPRTTGASTILPSTTATPPPAAAATIRRARSTSASLGVRRR